SLRLRAAMPVLVAVSLAAAGVGCAGSRAPYTARDLVRKIRSQGIDPATIVIPFELNAEMRQWAHQMVPDVVPSEKRLDRLLNAMLDPETLKLQYEAGYTGTAREVFETRKANCLGFTNLFVAMAREVEIPVYFMDVDDMEKFEKEGDLVVESGHVTAGF